MLFLFISLFTTLFTFSFAQTPQRTEAEENMENAKIIITGTINIIDRITCKIKTKKSEKKLKKWREEGRVDADCWHINEYGNLTEDKTDCWIDGYNYGEMWCSTCKEFERRHELERQKREREELAKQRAQQEKHEAEELLKQQYVDLGLPSGTLWKKWNEDNLYEYQDAIKQFGNQILEETEHVHPVEAAKSVRQEG